jgi:hypothetical protein
MTGARLVLLVAVGALMAALPATALAKHNGKRHHTNHHWTHQTFGTVYTATNDPAGTRSCCTRATPTAH